MTIPPWRQRTVVIERARRIVQQARHRSLAATRQIRLQGQRATRVVRGSRLSTKAQDNWIVLLAIGLLLISLLLARISAMGQRSAQTNGPGSLDPGLSEPSVTALAQLEGTAQPSATGDVPTFGSATPSSGAGPYPEPFASPVGIGTPPASPSTLTPGLPTGGHQPGGTAFPTLGSFPGPSGQQPSFPVPTGPGIGFPPPSGSSPPDTQPGGSYPPPEGPVGVGTPPPFATLPPLPSPTRQAAVQPTFPPPPTRGVQQPAATPRPPAAQPTRSAGQTQVPGSSPAYPQPGTTVTAQPTSCPSCFPDPDQDSPRQPTTEPEDGTPAATPTRSNVDGLPTPMPTDEPTDEPTPEPPPPTAVPMRPITGQTRWRLADSPVILDQDHIVERGASLTIDPGVEVRLAPGVRLFVSGALVAAGNSSAPVRFSSAGAGRWGGIRVNEGGQARISGSRLTGAGAEDLALFASGGSLVVEDSVVSGGSGRIVSYNSTVDIRRSSIVGNQLAGSALAAVLGPGQHLTLVDNRVAENSLAGGPAVQVFVNGSSALTIQGNRLLVQGGSGTNLLVSASAPYQARIACNTLIGGAIGLDLDTNVPSASGFSVNVEQNVFQNHSNRGAVGDLNFEVRNNWWGDPSGPYEATRNPSGRGDAVGVNLAFDPWLTGWPGCAPQP